MVQTTGGSAGESVVETGAGGALKGSRKTGEESFPKKGNSGAQI